MTTEFTFSTRSSVVNLFKGNFICILQRLKKNPEREINQRSARKENIPLHVQEDKLLQRGVTTNLLKSHLFLDES